MKKDKSFWKKVLESSEVSEEEIKKAGLIKLKDNKYLVPSETFPDLSPFVMLEFSEQNLLKFTNISEYEKELLNGYRDLKE